MIIGGVRHRRYMLRPVAHCRGGCCGGVGALVIGWLAAFQCAALCGLMERAGK